MMGGGPGADGTCSATRSSRQHRVELHLAEINVEVFRSYAPIGSEFPFHAAAARPTGDQLLPIFNSSIY
jgi:hypothetical protein